MNDGQLALRPIFQRFLEALPLHEIGITPAQLSAGLDEMYAQLLRVGLFKKRLPLQVRGLHEIAIDDSKPADARSDE